MRKFINVNGKVYNIATTRKPPVKQRQTKKLTYISLPHSTSIYSGGDSLTRCLSIRCRKTGNLSVYCEFFPPPSNLSHVAQPLAQHQTGVLAPFTRALKKRREEKK